MLQTVKDASMEKQIRAARLLLKALLKLGGESHLFRGRGAWAGCLVSQLSLPVVMMADLIMAGLQFGWTALMRAAIPVM